MQAVPRYPRTWAFCLPRLFLLWATMAVNGFEFRLSLGCASFGSPSSCSGSGSPPEPTNGEPTNGEPPEPTNEEPEAEPEPEPEPPSREVRARSLAPLSSHATVEVPECPTPTMITSRCCSGSNPEARSALAIVPLKRALAGCHTCRRGASAEQVRSYAGGAQPGCVRFDVQSTGPHWQTGPWLLRSASASASRPKGMLQNMRLTTMNKMHTIMGSHENASGSSIGEGRR